MNETLLDELALSILSCSTCGDYTEKVVKKTGEVKRTFVVKIPAHHTRLTDSSTNPVPGQGPINAKYLWVGEAPGEDEDAEGAPFVGKSGKYLKRYLIPQLARIRLDDCRFTNIIKCHPIGNRDPLKGEIAACMPWLEEEIKLVKPEIIFTVGAVATKALLGESLKTTHGQVFEKDGLTIMPLYHPAGVDRAIPKQTLEQDYKRILSSLKAAQDSHGLRKPDTSKYLLIETPSHIEALDNAIKKAQSFSLDIETDESEHARAKNTVDPLTNKVIGIAFGFGIGIKRAFYLPVKDGHEAETFGLVNDWIKGKEIIIHNAKFEMESLAKYGVTFDKVFCTYLAAYALREETLGLKDIVRRNFAITMTSLSDLIDMKKQVVSEIPLDELAMYACADADYAFRYAMDARLDIMERKQHDYYYDILLGLLPWVVEQELAGIEIDLDKLAEIKPYFDERIDYLRRTVEDIYGVMFNINSAPQKAEMLFEYFELPPTKMTKLQTHPSTDKDSLKPLLGLHPVVSPLLEYSSLRTIRSTFIEGIPKLIHQETGRLHASVNQAMTVTSRLSYSGPNWQNLPVRREESKRIREIIVPDEGHDFIMAVDQSQIELRWAAHLSQDEWMLATLIEGRSIHAETCRFIYGVAEDDPAWGYLYKNSKNGNFARLYGATAYKLMETLECSLEKAEEFLIFHRQLMSGFDAWCKGQIRHVRKLGYVETHWGFRRYVPEIKSRNKKLRSQGERYAVNVPVQGSAAEQIQLAMVAIQKAMDEGKLRTRMIIQVHDELVFSLPKEEVEWVVSLARDKLENIVSLSVPTPVEIAIGPSWGELEPYNAREKVPA